MTVRRRLLGLQAIAAIGFLVLAGQLVRVQWLDPAVEPGFDAGAAPRVVETEAPRGLITDRAGNVLARNVPAFSLVAIPGDFPADPHAQATALIAAASASGIPLPQLHADVVRGLASVDPLAPVTLLDGLSSDQAIMMRAATAGLSGVDVRATPGRTYAGGPLFAHILGYVGAIEPGEVTAYLAKGYPLNASVGRDGIEHVYQDVLRGQPGRRLVLSTPDGRELTTLGDEPARPGDNVELAVDSGLQRSVATALKSGIDGGLREPDQGVHPLAAGAAVVLDVHTGEVLAMVSLPSYDANLFNGAASAQTISSVLQDPARPLVDRSYMEAHAPGSTFKPLVAAAALQEGIATPGTTITSTGAITVQDVYDPGVTYTFHDWTVNGTMNLEQGIARSSDVYFYYLAGGYTERGKQLFTGLGPDRIAEYARAAGLGSPTGVDLPGETDGLVPDPAWKQRAVGDPWYLGDTYTYGIGQGYLTATPLQMGVLAAAIANGGDVLVPHVVRGIEDDGYLNLVPAQVKRRLPVSPEHLQTVRDGMHLAASDGNTAALGKPVGIDIGGKTGTAEFGDRNPDGVFPTHAWYIGFAPFDNPQIAVAVYLEHGIGGVDAAPVARQIFQAYFATRPQPPVARAATP